MKNSFRDINYESFRTDGLSAQFIYIVTKNLIPSRMIMPEKSQVF